MHTVIRRLYYSHVVLGRPLIRQQLIIIIVSDRLTISREYFANKQSACTPLRREIKRKTTYIPTCTGHTPDDCVHRRTRVSYSSEVTRTFPPPTFVPATNWSFCPYVLLQRATVHECIFQYRVIVVRNGDTENFLFGET